MNSSVYLVVEPIGIIASDLAMNVQEYNPSATVLIALAHEAASAVLQGYEYVRLAFVHADPSGFAMTDLARALAERKAKVVFTGDAAERNDSGILVLHRPFSSETTAALLQRAEMSETA
jgi:hypothetical protein